MGYSPRGCAGTRSIRASARPQARVDGRDIHGVLMSRAVLTRKHYKANSISLVGFFKTARRWGGRVWKAALRLRRDQALARMRRRDRDGRHRRQLLSMFFDPDWYERMYPDAAQSIRAGKFQNPLDHYEHVGATSAYSPSDDFDETWYREKHRDVQKSVKAGRFISGYEHYLIFGSTELRDPNPYFSEMDYRKDHPEILLLISAGKLRSGFEHFCKNRRPRRHGDTYLGGRWIAAWHRRWLGRLPHSPSFAEAIYLDHHPDVERAISEGRFRSGCQHWLEHGVIEDLCGTRARLPNYSEVLYLRQNPDVSAAVDRGDIPSGYHHFLTHGYAESRSGWTNTSELPPLTYDFPALIDRAKALANPPLISIAVPVYHTSLHQPGLLEKCIESIRRQAYPNWELCLVDDGSPSPHIRQTILHYKNLDARIKATFLDSNRGISAASNAAIALASGEWVALVDYDDELSPDALLEVASAIVHDPSLELIYSDEDKISADGQQHYDAQFKPGWSPELLHSTMYVGHLTVHRKALIEQVGAFRSQFDGTQDYDLMLRLAEVVTRVHHIPKILYHWRATPTSAAFSVETKMDAFPRQKRALEESLERLGRRGRIVSVDRTRSWRTIFDQPQPHPLVSVIIPTAGNTRTVCGRTFNLVRNCVQSLIDSEFYDNFEILVIHNGDLERSVELWLEKTPNVRLVLYERAVFNFCEKMNLGVSMAHGEYILLLNDDIEAITPRFVHEMIGTCSQPDIGAVAPKLIYANGAIQHVGVVINAGGPVHICIGEHAGTRGPQDRLLLTHNTLVATGACLLMRRDLYIELAGLDERLSGNYNDVDLCFKIQQRGLRVVMEPGITLYHFESLSKPDGGTFPWQLQAFHHLWGIAHDPFFNSNFRQDGAYFQLENLQEKRVGNFETLFQTEMASRRHITVSDKIKLPRFSLIQATYNIPYRYLRELEQTILNQTYTDFEWIVVENGSQLPETLRWFEGIRHHPQVRGIKLDENLGIMGGNRTAFEAATGDYIVPIDSDDLLTVDALMILAASIQAHDWPGILYSDECKTDPRSSLVSPFHKPGWDPVLFTNICYCCHLGCVRRDVARSSGCFSDDKATWCHDWDTNWRAYRAGYDPVHVPEVIYAWRIHPGSTASRETSQKPDAVISHKHVLAQQLELGGWGKELDIAQNDLFSHDGIWRLRPKVGIPDNTSVVIDIEGRSRSDLMAVFSDLAANRPSRVVLLTPEGNDKLDAALTERLGDIPIDVAHRQDFSSVLRRVARDKQGFVAWLAAGTSPVRQDWLLETAGLLSAIEDAVVAGGRVVGK